MLRILAAVLLLVTLAPSLAFAQAPNTLSWQGVLTNADGTLVADGSYDVTFRLYDVISGGAALWSENHPVVLVERGGFSVVLGQLTVLPQAFERQLYLGIQIAADPELVPRVALTSSPYALGLRFPFAETRTMSGPMLDLRNIAGTTARFRGVVEVGGDAANGQLRVYRGGIGSPFASLSTLSEGGSLEIFDEGGNSTHSIQPDVHGSGGFFSIARGVGALGFTVDGNSGGNQPIMSILGSSRSAVFDMAATANGSVQLPADAISATEMLDEPGVASITNNTLQTMDGTTQNLLTRSITVPAAGYCLVIGTLEAQAIHAAAVQDGANFGVTDASGTFQANQDHLFQIPANAAAGNYVVPITVHGLFAVNAGLNTFYLVGDEAQGNVQWNEGQLSIVYIPTSYGTVSPTLVAGGGEESVMAPLSAAEERREAEAFHRARLEREMAATQAEVAELKRQLEQVVAQQSTAKKNP